MPKATTQWCPATVATSNEGSKFHKHFHDFSPQIKPKFCDVHHSTTLQVASTKHSEPSQETECAWHNAAAAATAGI